MKPEFTTPRTRVERIVTQCWSEVLGRSDIGPDENFFDVGGTSHQAVKLHALLRQRLNADIPILALFQYPSVREFVETFVGGQRVEGRTTLPAPPGAPAPAATTKALTPAERAARQQAAFRSWAAPHPE
jgi:acyl carrier protein